MLSDTEFRKHFASCPVCRTEMDFGVVGPPKNLGWFKRPRRLWTGLHHLVAERLPKGGPMTNTPAARCRNCHIIVFPECAGAKP